MSRLALSTAASARASARFEHTCDEAQDLFALRQDLHGFLRAQQVGELRDFDFDAFELPCALAGTEFQREVWHALIRIPYGKTCSYGDLARHIGRPKAVRAVGAANGANPIPIIVPCHRVLASDGSLHGFGGGLDTKQRLLNLEQGQYQNFMLT